MDKKYTSREEFRNRIGGKALKEVTLTYTTGESFTLKAATPHQPIPDGLFVFVESDTGIMAVGGGSPQMLNFINEVILPSMLKEHEKTSTDENGFEELMKMMAGMLDDDSNLN